MADSVVSYRSKDGETLDEIVWRHYPRTVANALERVLGANPGLADHGPILPLGTVIQLPDLEPSTVEESVRLWG